MSATAGWKPRTLQACVSRELPAHWSPSPSEQAYSLIKGKGKVATLKSWLIREPAWICRAVLAPSKPKAPRSGSLWSLSSHSSSFTKNQQHAYQQSSRR